MLSVKDIEKATKLIARRERIEAAKWNAVVAHSGQFYSGEAVEKFDDELTFAVEEFRARKVKAINAELRALGVDPTPGQAG